MVQIIDEKVFGQEVLESELPVVVDFFASWCGPCRMMAPVLDRLSEELEGVCRFVKLDIDENMTVTSEYQIEAVPTFKIFKGGKVVQTVVGFHPQSEMKDILTAVL